MQELYDFEVVKGNEIVAAKRRVPLWRLRAAWPIVAELATSPYAGMPDPRAERARRNRDPDRSRGRQANLRAVAYAACVQHSRRGFTDPRFADSKHTPVFGRRDRGHGGLRRRRARPRCRSPRRGRPREARSSSARWRTGTGRTVRRTRNRPRSLSPMSAKHQVLLMRRPPGFRFAWIRERTPGRSSTRCSTWKAQIASKGPPSKALQASARTKRRFFGAGLARAMRSISGEKSVAVHSPA